MCAESLRVRLRQTAPIPLHLQLEVHAGELLALVGPSGSGKSTVLRSIAGLYQPRYGFIQQGSDTWLDTDRRIRESPQRRRTGLVFQDYSLFPHLNVFDNIKIAMGHIEPAGRREETMRLLDVVHLKGLEHRYPHGLSGGQQQRVAVARAIVSGPALVLADEPTANLDSKNSDELMDLFSHLNSHHDTTFVIATHDQRVMAHVPRLVRMLDGRIVDDVRQHAA